MADSWLTDGNCDVCRRRNYCHTPCKRSKVRFQMQMMSQAVEVAHSFLTKSSNTGGTEDDD